MTLSVLDDIPLYTSVQEIVGRLHFHAQLDIPDEQLGSIVAKYELPSARENWTTCGWNSCAEPHRFGFVISDLQGRETTCGNRCALTKGGVQFKEVIARHKAREERIARQKVVGDLLRDRTASEVAVTNAATAVRNALSDYHVFARHFQPIWRPLQDAAKSGGVVRAAIQQTDWSMAMGRKEELEIVARIAGYKALTTDGQGLAVGLHLARQWHIDTLHEEVLMSKEDDELKAIVRDADRHREKVRLGVEYAVNVEALIAPSNVHGFEAIVERVLRVSSMATARAAVETWSKLHAELKDPASRARVIS